MRMKRARRCCALQHRLAAHEHIDGARHDVAEGAEAFLVQQLLREAEGARDLVAAAENFFLGHVLGAAALLHARQRNLMALQPGDVVVVIGGRAQLVVTAAEELQQVLEKFSRRRRLDVVLQLHLADAAAQQDEQVLVVEQRELCARIVQQLVAVAVEGVRLQAVGEQLLRGLGAIQLGIERGLLIEIGVENGRDAANQLGGGVARVGDGEDFVGPRGFGLDEVRDAAREDGRLAGAGSRRRRAWGREHARWHGADRRWGGSRDNRCWTQRPPLRRKGE